MNRQIKWNSCMINYQTDHLSLDKIPFDKILQMKIVMKRWRRRRKFRPLLFDCWNDEIRSVRSIVITRAFEQCFALSLRLSVSPRHHHHQQLIEHIFFFFLIYLDKWRRCTIRLINAWIVPSDLLVFSICVEREIAGWMEKDWSGCVRFSSL